MYTRSQTKRQEGTLAMDTLHVSNGFTYDVSRSRGRRSSILKPFSLYGNDGDKGGSNVEANGKKGRRVSFALSYELKNYCKEQPGLDPESETLPVPNLERVSPLPPCERNEGSPLKVGHENSDRPPEPADENEFDGYTMNSRLSSFNYMDLSSLGDGELVERRVEHTRHSIHDMSISRTGSDLSDHSSASGSDLHNTTLFHNSYECSVELSGNDTKPSSPLTLKPVACENGNGLTGAAVHADASYLFGFGSPKLESQSFLIASEFFDTRRKVSLDSPNTSKTEMPDVYTIVSGLSPVQPLRLSAVLDLSLQAVEQPVAGLTTPTTSDVSLADPPAVANTTPQDSDDMSLCNSEQNDSSDVHSTVLSHHSDHNGEASMDMSVSSDTKTSSDAPVSKKDLSAEQLNVIPHVDEFGLFGFGTPKRDSHSFLVASEYDTRRKISLDAENIVRPSCANIEPPETVELVPEENGCSGDKRKDDAEMKILPTYASVPNMCLSGSREISPTKMHATSDKEGGIIEGNGTSESERNNTSRDMDLSPVVNGELVQHSAVLESDDLSSQDMSISQSDSDPTAAVPVVQTKTSRQSLETSAEMSISLVEPQMPPARENSIRKECSEADGTLHEEAFSLFAFGSPKLDSHSFLVASEVDTRRKVSLEPDSRSICGSDLTQRISPLRNDLRPQPAASIPHAAVCLQTTAEILDSDIKVQPVTEIRDRVLSVKLSVENQDISQTNRDYSVADSFMHDSEQRQEGSDKISAVDALQRTFTAETDDVGRPSVDGFDLLGSPGVYTKSFLTRAEFGEGRSMLTLPLGIASFEEEEDVEDSADPLTVTQFQYDQYGKGLSGSERTFLSEHSDAASDSLEQTISSPKCVGEQNHIRILPPELDDDTKKYLQDLRSQPFVGNMTDHILDMSQVSESSGQEADQSVEGTPTSNDKTFLEPVAVGSANESFVSLNSTVIQPCPEHFREEEKTPIETEFVRHFRSQIARVFLLCDVTRKCEGRYFLTITGQRSVIVLFIHIPLTIACTAEALKRIYWDGKLLTGKIRLEKIITAASAVSRSGDYLVNLVEAVIAAQRSEENVMPARLPPLADPPAFLAKWIKRTD